MKQTGPGPEPARYGPPGRDPLQRPADEKPWLQTERMPSAWIPLFANADPSGLEGDTDWPVEAADREEALYAADGYTFSGTTYAPHDDWEGVDAEGRPRDPAEPMEAAYDGSFGHLETFVWANAGVLESDLAAGKRPYPCEGAEYLLDAASEKPAWLPAYWWRLIEHGEWKASDFDDDEDEEHWGRDCAVEVLESLAADGWTPVRRIGNGYVERQERYRGYEGTLTLYLLRRGSTPPPVPPSSRTNSRKPPASKENET